MDQTIRKPFQGIGNVVRFNWHFYALALALLLFLVASALFISDNYSIYCYGIAATVLVTASISLLVTYYIYDCSPIYTLDYLDQLGITSEDRLVNIHSGFDEFSFIIAKKFRVRQLSVFDFYNPLKHTEVSIERARKFSVVFPGTKAIAATALPLEPNSATVVFVLFSAHEIRDTQERIVFFREIERSLAENGKAIVLEHLRDVPNFIAYTIGFFHFFPKSEWKKIFESAHLSIGKEMKITPFVSLFILQKNGITP